MFIALYGINNIGKTTHAKKLVERLNKEGHQAKYVKYPIYDLEPTGPYLNQILRGGDKQKISEAELQMWFTLNRHQFEPQIKKWLSQGYIVVAEDYIGTGIAWGIAKGLDTHWLERLNQYLLNEDLGILLGGSRVMKAKETKHIHEENDALIEKCKHVLQDLAEKYGWKNVLLQDHVADTAELIWKIVKSKL